MGGIFPLIYGVRIVGLQVHAMEKVILKAECHLADSQRVFYRDGSARGKLKSVGDGLDRTALVGSLPR